AGNVVQRGHVIILRIAFDSGKKNSAKQVMRLLRAQTSQRRDQGFSSSAGQNSSRIPRRRSNTPPITVIPASAPKTWAKMSQRCSGSIVLVLLFLLKMSTDPGVAGTGNDRERSRVVRPT